MNKSQTVILFVGPPGSGKGSLSQHCVQKLGWRQLSTGNMLRKHIAEGTELGKQIDFIIKSGRLVSDELINAMVEQWIKQVSSEGIKGLILDGYPRTVGQAKALQKFVKRALESVGLKVIRLQVDDQVVVKRISARWVCENRECQAVYSALRESSMQVPLDKICTRCGFSVGKRKDDQESTVRERLSTYRKHERDLLDFYHKSGSSVVECNAAQSLDSLFNEFKELMNIH